MCKSRQGADAVQLVEASTVCIRLRASDSDIAWLLLRCFASLSIVPRTVVVSVELWLSRRIAVVIQVIPSAFLKEILFTLSDTASTVGRSTRPII
jgi:hypothetical protein